MENKSNQYLQLVLDAKAMLAEGSFWNHKTQTLWWVDIEGKKFHIYNPDTKENKTYDVGQRIGTVVPDQSGGAIVALQNGIHHLDLETEELTLITNPLKDIPNIRFNDGKCDPSGRFWVGTMELNTKENAASLYKMESEGNITKVIDEVTISNGIIWSKDSRTMFYADTPTQKITVYDFDNKNGTISNGRTVIEIPKDMGSPDGITIDEEEKIWIAHFGGSCVCRWDPDDGKLLQKVPVPAPNVTSCAFGGKKMDTLFITTGREGLDEEKLKKYPASGGIFSVKPNVKGIMLNFFKGKL